MFCLEAPNAASQDELHVPHANPSLPMLQSQARPKPILLAIVKMTEASTAKDGHSLLIAIEAPEISEQLCPFV